MKILKLVFYMILFFSLMLTGCFVGSYFWIVDQMTPSKTEKSVDVKVPDGFNTKQIATILKQNKIIKSAFIFRCYVRLLAVGHKLRPGNYTFSTKFTLSDIVYRLLNGRMTSILVTIPEGSTLDKIGDILQNSEICSKRGFLKAVNDPKLIGSIFNDWSLIPAGEGLAFPETYRFSRNTSPSIVAAQMLKLTKHNIDKIFPDKLPNGLSPYEACILASIVEREAKLDSDRPLIASVFYNRLKSKRKLESCATVQYALPCHKDRLLFEDLKIDSPFNTYRYAGLPPTPISNFGKASLSAVANPANTKYLYFVANGTGGHSFAETLKKHNQNTKKYFKKRRAH